MKNTKITNNWNLTFSGTFDIQEVAQILRKYKEGSLNISETIWAIMSMAK